MPQQIRHDKGIVSGRHQRRGTLEQVGEGATLVDGEIVHDRLHGKRKRVLKFLFGGGHDVLESALRHRLNLGRKDKTHAASGHPAEHPEPPETIAKFFAYSVDERFGKMITRPRDDSLNWIF